MKYEIQNTKYETNQKQETGKIKASNFEFDVSEFFRILNLEYSASYRKRGFCG